MTQTTKQTKKKKKSSSFYPKYTKLKFTPDVILTIKKALLSYNTSELAEERKKALELFTAHEDYFIVMYHAPIKRKHVKSDKKPSEVIATLNKQEVLTFKEAVADVKKCTCNGTSMDALCPVHNNQVVSTGESPLFNILGGGR